MIITSKLTYLPKYPGILYIDLLICCVSTSAAIYSLMAGLKILTWQDCASLRLKTISKSPRSEQPSSKTLENPVHLGFFSCAFYFIAVLKWFVTFGWLNKGFKQFIHLLIRLVPINGIQYWSYSYSSASSGSPKEFWVLSTSLFITLF